ncbi:MAG: helix-turn-helix transcriptional regulator [Bacilli bacterium]|nr:helix-turn-helix transcriptional regulator [Bacilli bacterium]
MKTNLQLGKKITKLRLARGWNQEELAFRASLNRNYLSDLENGRRNPSLKVLEKIAFAFEISLEALFKGITTFPFV